MYKGRRCFTGQFVAMKVRRFALSLIGISVCCFDSGCFGAFCSAAIQQFIPKKGKSEEDVENLRQEIDILRRLNHDNIILMLDAFETPREFCVVTEFAQVRVSAPTTVPAGLPMP